MNYQRIYDELMLSRQHRCLSGIYFEKHHIIPRSMGGSNEVTNLVKLTAREHFLAHWLLWRIHRNKQTAFAFRCMYKFVNHKEKFSSIAYQEMREAYSMELSNFNKNRSPESRKKLSDALIGNKNGAGKRSEETKRKMSNSQKGRIVSEESKKKNSISHIGNSFRKGKPASDETKQKISDSKKRKTSPNKGKSMSDEQKRKISKISKNRIWYNDGIKNFFLKEDMISNIPKSNLKLGRIIHKNKNK